MAQAGRKPVMDITVFDGGLNTEVPAENLPWNQSPDLRSVVFDNYGALKSPAGYKTHNSISIGSAGIDGAFSFKPASMSALLLAVNGSVYVATGTATAFTMIASSQSLFTKNVECDVIQFQELAFISNGGQQAYKFNGTEFTRAGISAPTHVPATNSDAAGALTGEYRYVFWGVNSYSAEGDYGTATTVRTFASGKVAITDIPTAPISHGISYWKLGRNTAAASDVFWYLTDVTNGVTSYTDNVADESLVDEAPTDQGYLRLFKFMMSYGNRMWGAAENDSLLWFSNLNQPEEFPSGNYVRVGRGDGLQISAIKAFKGTIVISKSDFNGRTALYQLIIGDSVTFSDPESWNLVKLFDYGGSDSHRASVNYSDYMTLLNRDGMYAFNGMSFAGVASQTQNGAFISDKISENIASRLRVSGKEPFLRVAAAINWKEGVWLGIHNQTGLSNPANTGLYVFDYARISNSERKGGAWSYHNTTVPCQQFVVHEGMLLGTTNRNATGAYFYQLDCDDMYDEVSAASLDTMQYMTPRLKGAKSDESAFKDFRYIYVTCSGQGTLTVQTSNDGFANYDGSTNVETGTITLTTTATRHKINLGRTRGKDVQIFLYMPFADGDSVTITRLEIFYNPRGLRS